MWSVHYGFFHLDLEDCGRRDTGTYRAGSPVCVTSSSCLEQNTHPLPKIQLKSDTHVVEDLVRLYMTSLLLSRQQTKTTNNNSKLWSGREKTHAVSFRCGVLRSDLESRGRRGIGAHRDDCPVYDTKSSYFKQNTSIYARLG